MDQTCLVLPVLPRRHLEARDFLRQLDHGRRADYDRSERRLSISNEAWFAARVDGRDFLLAYVEAADVADAVKRFSLSRDAFDVWFKDALLQVTGIDLNDPLQVALPELLSAYRADVVRPPGGGRVPAR